MTFEVDGAARSVGSLPPCGGELERGVSHELRCLWLTPSLTLPRKDHPGVTELPRGPEVRNTFIFRYALCGYVSILKRIAAQGKPSPINYVMMLLT